MIPNRAGKIVNMSAVFAVRSHPFDEGPNPAYGTSKAAVIGLTTSMAATYAKHGITVNAIAPTFIHTDINDKQLADKAFYQSLVERIPMGRIGEFPDLMGLLLLLSSDASSFLTGQTFLLDGGIAAQERLAAQKRGHARLHRRLVKAGSAVKQHEKYRKTASGLNEPSGEHHGGNSVDHIRNSQYSFIGNAITAPI